MSLPLSLPSPNIKGLSLEPLWNQVEGELESVLLEAKMVRLPQV